MARRLAAILAADVVGYSKLMAVDEVGTLANLHSHRNEIFNPEISRWGGRIVKLMGDGTLVEFPSVVDAIEAAVAIQTALASDGGEIVLRIGINLGDIIIDGDDIYGDGVNIAARLEPLARSGGVCVSSIVNESVGGRTEILLNDGGMVDLKNIDRPMRVWHWHPEDAPANPAPARAVSAEKPMEDSSHTPSIAVLPFDNMSGDAEQEYFSDGISEDIITDLSKVPGLLVIARNSSFAYKGKSVDLRMVGRDLGVNSILEGSVRRAGNRVRVTAQLIDAGTGTHLWAERYDGDLTDIFAVQDEVTLQIVDALKIKLSPKQKADISGVGTTNIEAHDLFLRSRDLILSPKINAELNKRAIEHAESAIGIDPDYAQAHAGLAIGHLYDFMNGWSGNDPAGILAKAQNLADRSIKLDPNDAFSHHVVSLAARLAKNLETANSEVEKALALNPNFANSLFTRGEIAIFTGRPAQAIPDLERAIRLDPGFSHQYLHFLGVAHLLLGNYETAALIFRERIILADRTDTSRAMLAAALGHLGDIEDARQIWNELLEITPSFSMEKRLEIMSFGELTDMSQVWEGLEKAGLPG